VGGSRVSRRVTNAVRPGVREAALFVPRSPPGEKLRSLAMAPDRTDGAARRLAPVLALTKLLTFDATLRRSHEELPDVSPTFLCAGECKTGLVEHDETGGDNGSSTSTGSAAVTPRPDPLPWVSAPLGQGPQVHLASGDGGTGLQQSVAGSVQRVASSRIVCSGANAR
jgi:hypothetical protein